MRQIFTEQPHTASRERVRVCRTATSSLLLEIAIGEKSAFKSDVEVKPLPNMCDVTDTQQTCQHFATSYVPYPFDYVLELYI